MKKHLYILLCCVLSLNVFTACSDDDDDKCTIVNPNLQEFTLTRLENTNTTISFRVTPKMEEHPYICVYVDKKIIDRVPKYDLVDYLMSDLKKQAERKEVSFGEYLASIALTGEQELQAEGLMPGGLYEVVAFGISGEMAADKPATLFMQTALVEKVDFDLNVKVTESTPDFTKISITPSNEEKSYFFGLMEKSNYDNLSQSYSNGSLLMALFAETYEAMLWERADEDGYVTQEDIDEVIEEIFYEGSIGLKISGPVQGTEIVWLSGVFEVVATDEGDKIVLASDVQKGEFTFGLDVAPEAENSSSAEKKIKLGGETWSEGGLYLPVAHPAKRVLK